MMSTKSKNFWYRFCGGLIFAVFLAICFNLYAEFTERISLEDGHRNFWFGVVIFGVISLIQRTFFKTNDKHYDYN